MVGSRWAVGVALVSWTVAGALGLAAAGTWSRAYVRTLPDDAFAVVETAPDGTRLRRLPHHDAQGRVDVAHLRSALGRLNQVHWLDPVNAERARAHLREHLERLAAGRDPRSGLHERAERRGGAR